jgi:hypothetical protein
MMNSDAMSPSSVQTYARIAGWSYLIIAVERWEQRVPAFA